MNIVDDKVISYHAGDNITATLSARMGNAQPWRFFYCSEKLKKGQLSCR